MVVVLLVYPCLASLCCFCCCIRGVRCRLLLHERGGLLTSLLLIDVEFLPVLPLEFFQLTEYTVLLLLGQCLPRCFNVGDDVTELNLVGALDEGTCVAGSFESPSLFFGDHSSSTEEGGRAETASGSTSDVLADHDYCVVSMTKMRMMECRLDDQSVEERDDEIRENLESRRKSRARLAGSSLALALALALLLINSSLIVTL